MQIEEDKEMDDRQEDKKTDGVILSSTSEELRQKRKRGLQKMLTMQQPRQIIEQDKISVGKRSHLGADEMYNNHLE